MGSIEKYKEEQKALVVYYQSGASFIEKKTEKWVLQVQIFLEKCVFHLQKNNKSIEKHGGKNGSLNQD